MLFCIDFNLNEIKVMCNSSEYYYIILLRKNFENNRFMTTIKPLYPSKNSYSNYNRFSCFPNHKNFNLVMVHNVQY